MENLGGALVTPGLIDVRTHSVYTGNRDAGRDHPGRWRHRLHRHRDVRHRPVNLRDGARERLREMKRLRPC
ncbi:cytosine/adenosine deaminase-related metal-dependent hydrolase [Nonomuraea angiospora]|uniref:Cytosine/adenosine deaminase-related metal-dependent hydrolase n=1 Tax=Nonomuraea angiospora TaxID=46172 RepID=A0ABR9M1F1_9ACTN|nr:cytosine/adenosine deaminase-related metal-dependent hydrolase [Nonomuraea angiospora]